MKVTNIIIVIVLALLQTAKAQTYPPNSGNYYTEFADEFNGATLDMNNWETPTGTQ